MNINILKKEEKAVFTLRELYSSYGYTPYKMSKFEEYDLYAGNKDFLVSDRVITFNDTDGRLLALKPDVTLSIVKNTVGGTRKVYYNENVYRVSGATGQFKEIMQTGLECIGEITQHDIFEVVYLAAESLSKISDDFVLDISHMGVITAILESLELTTAAKKRITALISEKNAHELKEYCASIGIENDKTDTLMKLVSVYGDRKKVLERLSESGDFAQAASAIDELRRLDSFIDGFDKEGRVRFDFSVVNDMSYYNGIVFKGFVNGIADGVLSGGEYGKLLPVIGSEGNAIGFALYLDMLSELDSEYDRYDVDVLLQYSEGDDPALVFAEKARLIVMGNRVFASVALPDKLRYARLVRFGEDK